MPEYEHPIVTFESRVSNELYQRLLIVLHHFHDAYHEEMQELFEHAHVQGKFEIVLKNFERYVREFVLRNDIPARLSDAEKALGLDLPRIFFYRIRSYILLLTEPVH